MIGMLLRQRGVRWAIGVAAIVLVFVVGSRVMRSLQEHRQHVEFFAANCPEATTNRECDEAMIAKEAARKQHMAAMENVSPTPSAPPTIPAAKGGDGPPLATALAGIAQLQSLVRARKDSVKVETENQCQARKDRNAPTVAAARLKIGDRRLARHTRYAASAPDLGQTIDDAVSNCLDGCVLQDDDDESPSGSDAIALEWHLCEQAATALVDLAAELSAAR